MYESYFGFKDTPFRLSADETFRYAHKNYLRASAYLAYALEQGEGFVMITGQPGSGKTTLIRDVISELDVTRYHTLNLVTSQLQAEELLRKVALEYGFPAESYNKATLLTNIHKHLSALHEKGKQSILFLDEAQNLSLNGLEELRLLSNLQQGRDSLLQVVLAGHEDLRQRLLNPDMEHIQQRLIAICQIESLPMAQTREYITHRLEHVGWQTDPQIEDEVFQLIHMASQGVPRNINHLMSHLLLLAYLEEKHNLTDEDALTVIEELVDQQRISLAGEERFESFVSKYRAEKQQLTRHHAVASQSVISLPPQGRDPRHIDQQHSLTSTNRTTGKSLTPANDKIAPESDTQPKDPESDIQDKGPGPEPTLPSADEIWNGAIESSDMDTLFPYNRQPESTVSAEPSNLQSTTQPVGGEVLKDSEHRWGGVWFMSSGNTIQPSANHHQGASSITETTLPTGPTSKTNHNIAVDENLSIPSVWVEECPEIVAADNDDSIPHLKIANGSKNLKRSIAHVIALVSIGLMAMLAVRMYPVHFDHYVNETETQVFDLAGRSQEFVPPLVPGTAQDREPSNISHLNGNEMKEIEAPSYLSDQQRTVIHATEIEHDQDVDLFKDLSADLDQNKPEESAPATLATKITDVAEAKIEVNVTPVSNAVPLKAGDPDISSFHNIELATRYYVYFDFNKSDIPSTYEPLLKSIRNKMLLEENNYLKITGYADSQGNGNYNYRLSMKRAEEVRQYFSVRGIADGRLQVAAVGQVGRVGTGLESIDDRQKIRRVELILFPK
ncbi:MAG: AAA family ATPase [Candidatus Thiodiazotropha sp.]